ncbi:hypothetical protein HMI56_005088 [Coelomomyces lativittatus]|nr:hypothetical protein HMI56_005088 [Coelomomyces lativittatus]
MRLLSLQRGLDESLVSIANTPNAIQSPSDSVQPLDSNIDITLKDWPVVPPKLIPDTIISNMGPMFFFCSVTVVFISVLQLIVSEKELKLRHAMEMMGLKPSIYWLTLFLNQSVLVFIAALMTCILGLLCQFTVFTQTDFSVTLLLFFLFGLAMVAFGCIHYCFLSYYSSCDHDRHADVDFWFNV